MLTNPQKSLLKRAQREAGLTDAEYREALQTVACVQSSTSPALTDRHLDQLLAYFEAIHWRAVDARTLQPSCSAAAVFRQRGYWAAKNTRQETSRDRYNGFNLAQAVADLEAQLATLGFGPEYCAGIRLKAAQDRTDARGLHLYRAALKRTLNAKTRREEAAGKTY
jgi:hypothetical protein